jgi:hypothetical protein
MTNNETQHYMVTLRLRDGSVHTECGYWKSAGHASSAMQAAGHDYMSAKYVETQDCDAPTPKRN